MLFVLLVACGGTSPPPPIEIPSTPPPPPTAKAPAETPRSEPHEAPAPRPHASPSHPSLERDPPSGPCDVAQAEQTFETGRRAAANGDWSKARDAFRESYACDPALGTLLNLANAEEKLGDTRSAIKHYEEVYLESTKQNRPDRAQLAKQRADALRAKP